MAVLALDYADRSVLGAVAPQLERDFHIGSGKIGVLASVFAVVAGLATLPFGVLTDRMRRTRLLAIGVIGWTAAMTASALAVSFVMLLCSRAMLGIMTAVAGPTSASLTGDLYPSERRGRVLGFISGGELVGTGFGFAVAASTTLLVSWRFIFLFLALFGLVVAYAFHRLEEPRRRAGADADFRNLWGAVRYVVDVRTNLILIVAESVGFFFFAGVRTFAVIFTVHRYGIATATGDLLLIFVGIGALVGMLASGRLADALSGRRHASGRILISVVAYPAAAILFLPAILLPSLTAALPLYILGGVAVGAASPPLAAVRLDVIRPGMWGRAEAVRTMLRVAGEGLAPLVFGLVADTAGPKTAFLVFLPSLALNGVILLFARHTYPRDVEAAAATPGAPGAARGAAPRPAHTDARRRG
jgi:predicted MFS family arabinose efflux permease